MYWCLKYLSKNLRLFRWQKHQGENCVMREAAGTTSHPPPACPGAEGPSLVARQKVWAASVGQGRLLLNLLHTSAKGCEIEMFHPRAVRESQLHSKELIWTLFHPHDKCYPASPCSVYRQNAAAHQSSDTLFHDYFPSPHPHLPLRGCS